MNTRTHDAIRLTAPMQLRAAPEGPSQLPSQFTGIAYSGGLVPSYGMVIDLSSTNITPVMPLLSEHDRTNMVGMVNGAQKLNGQIVVAGKLYSDMAGSKAEQIAQLSQRGFPFQMSVGLFGFSEEELQPGQRALVNGRDVAGPVTVLRNGTVRECSICALGADPNTEARFFNSPHAREHQIAALFREIGEQPTAEQRAAYLAMPSASFATFVATVRSLAAKARTVRDDLDRLSADTWRDRRALSLGKSPDARQRSVGLSAAGIYASRRATVTN